MDRKDALVQYMRWYKSWATLYVLQAPTDTETLDSYYSRATSERVMRDWLVETEDVFRPYFGNTDSSPQQAAIDRFEEICTRMHRSVYFTDAEPPSHARAEPTSEPTPSSMDPGPSSFTIPATPAFAAPPPPTYPMWTPYPMPWGAPLSTPSAYDAPGPSTLHQSQLWPPSAAPMPYGHHFWRPSTSMPSQEHQPMIYPTQQSVTAAQESEPEDAGEHGHHLRDRPRRPPKHYTPGSGAIPPKHRRRQ